MKRYICDVCNGLGALNNENYDECPKCKGFGHLNWLENIFGKDISKMTSKEILKEILYKESIQVSNEIDKHIVKTLLKKEKKK